MQGIRGVVAAITDVCALHVVGRTAGSTEGRPRGVLLLFIAVGTSIPVYSFYTLSVWDLALLSRASVDCRL